MRKILFSLFVLISNLFFGQEVNLTVQTGHAASINTVVFSPNDEIIASSGDDNKIVIWDFNSSKQYGLLLGHQSIVTGIVFSPDTKILYSTSLDSTLRIWDVYNETCLKIIKFNAPLGGIDISDDGKLLFVCGKRITIVDTKSHIQTEIEFKAKSIFTSIDISKNNDLIAFGGENEDFAYIVDIHNNILIRKFVAPVKKFQFDEAQNSLFYSTTDGKVIEYKLNSMKSNGATTDWMLNSINSFILTDNVLFIANDYGNIQLINRAKKWFEIGQFKGIRGKIRSLDISNNGKYIASAGDNRSVVIWDINTGQVVKVLKGLVNRVNDIKFSKDGSEILIGYTNGTVRHTNLISNQSTVNRVKFKSIELGSKSNYSITRIEKFTMDSVIFSMLYLKNSLIYQGSYDKIQEYLVCWDLEKNLLELEKTKEESKKIKNYIKALKAGHVYDYNYFLDSTLIWATNDSLDRTVKVLDGILYIYENSGNKLLHQIKTNHSDIVTSVSINPVYNYVATASWDGMIRFWDIETGDLLTIYGAFGNGQFVYLNEEGYYYSSKNALDYIGFKLNNKIYSFEQFDLKYNRPDIVAKSLPYFNENYISAYYGAYKKRLSKLGITEEDIDVSENLPMLEVEKELIEGDEIDKLVLSVDCRDDNYNLDKLHLKINGVPEFGRYGRQLDGNIYKEEIELNINPGTNYIQLSVTNKMGVSSYKQVFSIESHKKERITNLYLMTIGVSKFKQNQYNLEYARKDAEDVKRFFKINNLFFNNVYAKSMYDEDATLENIEDLKKFANLANENDIVILFIAGHGVLDVNLDYYFASHDMDFSSPQTRGIPYELFEEVMDNTKSRKKVMFIDACHSGEIDKDEVVENLIAEEENGELIFRGALRSISNKYDINSFDLSKSLFADMRLNNGATVVSSAGGAEYAIEGEQWNNGVFTYVLLKGLMDFKADYNDDKEIYLSELQTYIQFEVNRITKGLQTPTSRVENLNNDFRIR